MRWSKNETIGFLHRFWWTVLEVSPSGDITALSSPEVMGEALDMPVDVIARALKVMEDPDPKLAFLDRKDGKLLIHDWLDYAGRYLSESKYKRNPEKMESIRHVHGQSLDKPRIVPDTNQPNQPNQPTNHKEIVPAAPGGPPGVKPKAKKPDFPPTSRAYQAARFFWSYVREWSPQAIEPTEAGYQAWARDCDLMFRKDGRSDAAFNELLDWIDSQPVSRNGFTWRKNVLSPGTLRERWKEGKFADFLPSELAKPELQ